MKDITERSAAIAACEANPGPHACPIEVAMPGGWWNILELPNELQGFVLAIMEAEDELEDFLTEEFWRRVYALPTYKTNMEMGNERRLYSGWVIAADYDNGDQD